MAQWLDTFFSSFDLGLFTAMHELAVFAGENAGAEISSFLTYLMHFISFFAHDGICMLLLGLGLMIPRRTRKLGVCVFAAVCCGAVITNLTIKPLVARIRPYANFEHLAGTVESWWVAVGEARKGEDIFASFPSGHTTATTAAMLALFLGSHKKKRVWPVLIFPFLMGASRIYLMVHYGSDVLAGLLCGSIGAVVAFLIATRILFPFLEKHRDNKFCRFCLDFEPVAFLKGLKKPKHSDET